MSRRIFPSVVTVTAAGATRLPAEQVGAVSEAIVAARRENPGG